MQVDITGWELHNVVRDANGLRTRRGFAATMDFATNDIVASFTVENSKSGEIWWYVFVWDSTAKTVTLRVYDEGREFGSSPLFSYPLGAMSRDVVITMAQSYGQLMFNSPSFSSPLYGWIGGGVCQMLPVKSDMTDEVTLNPPVGHCCTFGDRWAVAQENAVYFPDAGIEGTRSFTAGNVIVLPGSILDMFQAVDGSLYMFTTNGCYTLGPDALSTGQLVTGFISAVDGVVTTASRNAVSTMFGVVVLERDGISVLNGGRPQKLPIPRYTGRRRISRPVDVDDYRTFGRLFATASGFLMGFGRNRDMFLHADLRTGTFSWMYGVDSQNQPTALHGVLSSRDGDQLLCFQHTVVAAMLTGGSDSFDGETKGYICGLLPVDVSDQPLFRRVTLAVANAGGSAGVAMSPAENVLMTTQVHTGDVVIGSSVWSSTTKIASYNQRTTRCTLNVRTTEPHIELMVGGCDRRIASSIDLQMSGTWRQRKDRQP